MIHVRWSRAKGKLTIDVEGHEFEPGSAPPEGAITCAAVSAIAQTALYGMMAIGMQHPDKVIVEEVPAT